MTTFAFQTSLRRPDHATAPSLAKPRTGIHASAVIAGACYGLGVAAAVAINPAAAHTLATVDGISLVLLLPYAAFLASVALIQRREAIAPRCNHHIAPSIAGLVVPLGDRRCTSTSERDRTAQHRCADSTHRGRVGIRLTRSFMRASTESPMQRPSARPPRFPDGK